MSRFAKFRGRQGDRFRQMGSILKQVGNEEWATMKSKPKQTFRYIVTLAFGLVTYKTAPTHQQFIGDIVDASNSLVLIYHPSQESEEHVQRMFTLQNHERLRHANFLFFSVMYESEWSQQHRSYVSQCKYSNPRWHEFPGRVLDVGFLGRWWVNGYKMVDYDVETTPVEIATEVKEEDRSFSSWFERAVSVTKRMFGYGEFSNIVSQPLKTSFFVETKV